MELRSSNNDRMILEGIVTTVNIDGSVNISPMGPEVDRLQTTLVLKPFATSRTCANLLRTHCGVFHVVDDSLLLASAAIDRWVEKPNCRFDESIDGYVLPDACRALVFELGEVVSEGPRNILGCRINKRLQWRDGFGWNRAQHAVLELAILATRLHLIESERLVAEIRQLRPLVEKTGGDRERQAWQLLLARISETVTDVDEWDDLFLPRPT
jgi:hypothetical protein